MTRHRTTSAGALALVVGLSLATAGCGKYSWSKLVAQKSYKDANALYGGSDWRGAAAKYEEALKSDPDKVEIFFYLGNSYDNQFKVSRLGEPENDANDPQGDRQLREGGRARPETGDQEAGAPVSRLGVRPGKAERSGQGRADRPEDDSARAGRAGQLLRALEDLPGLRPLRGRRAGPDEGPRGQAQRSHRSTRRWRGSTTPRASSTRRWKRSTRRRSSIRTIRRATSCWRPTTGRRSTRTIASSTAEKKEYLAKGVEAVNKALALNPDYSEALGFKNLLLRLQGNEETDLAKRAAYYKEADQLRNRCDRAQQEEGDGAGTVEIPNP